MLFRIFYWQQSLYLCQCLSAFLGLVAGLLQGAKLVCLEQNEHARKSMWSFRMLCFHPRIQVEELTIPVACQVAA